MTNIPPAGNVQFTAHPVPGGGGGSVRHRGDLVNSGWPPSFCSEGAALPFTGLLRKSWCDCYDGKRDRRAAAACQKVRRTEPASTAASPMQSTPCAASDVSSGATRAALQASRRGSTGRCSHLMRAELSSPPSWRGRRVRAASAPRRASRGSSARARRGSARSWSARAARRREARGRGSRRRRAARRAGGEVLRARLATADRRQDLDAQRVRDRIKPASVHARPILLAFVVDARASSS
jgi:hypothetical protein